MIRRVFVDTNVFIYARDDRHPTKQHRARHWLEALATRNLAVVSPQVLGELHNAILKSRVPIPATEARRTTLALEAWSVGATDLDLIAEAWLLRERTGFQWWDCVVLASAIRADCAILLSEDYQDGRLIDGTKILNPFRADPLTVLTDQ